MTKEVESAVRAHLDVGQEASQTLAEMASGLAKLPARLDRVLTVIERGQKPGAAAAGDRPRHTPRPAAWAALALGFLGGNQWLATAPKVAIACWAVAGLAALWLVWRSLPPAPMEP